MNESKANLGGSQPRKTFANVARRTALLYALVGSLWILFSDRILSALVSDLKLHEEWEDIKGYSFITITALLLYAELKRQFSRIQNESDARQLAEAAQRSTEDRFHSLLKLAPVPLALVDKTGKLIFSNDHATQLFGYTPAEVPTIEHWWALVHPDPEYRREVIQSWTASAEKAVRENTDIKPAEYKVTCKDGTVRTVEVSGIFFDEGILATFLDLTERKQIETALRQSEELYRSLFQNMLNGLAHCQMHYNAAGEAEDFTYLQVNEAFTRLTGLQDVAGKKVSAVIPGIREHDFELIQTYGRVARTGVPEAIEIFVTALNAWFAISIYSPSRDHFVAIFDVITRRKQAEEQLQILSQAVEQSPASIVITDAKGDIEYVNAKFIAATGYTFAEVRGKNPRILKSGETSPETYTFLWHTLKSGKEWRGELHNRRKNGELFWEEARISPVLNADGCIIHYLAVKEDITDRKNADAEIRKLEEEFRQAQKMKAVGQLASGVAHDFNNLLTVIQGHCSLMQVHEKFHHELRESVGEITRAAERAANLTRQLLAFSRRQPLQPRDLNINEVINGTTKMLQRILGEDVALQVNYSSQPLVVHADKGMLDQILLNLAVNSRDAMPHGGQLVIGLAPAEFAEVIAADKREMPAGSFVHLSVSDTGSGIPPEVLPRIFEPFFTTKAAGQGTGLGLATVYGIVQQHQGWITVESATGRGTTFHIYLPRVEANAVTVTAAEPPAITARGGGETILVAEDFSAIRILLRNTLRQLGYRVLEAPTGIAALEIWNKERNQISLLLTDLVMPDGMTGIELAREVEHDNPRLPVVFISGYSPEIAGREIPLREGENFLAKPFTPQQLAETVRKSLDAAQKKQPA